jgi:nephron
VEQRKNFSSDSFSPLVVVIMMMFFVHFLYSAPFSILFLPDPKKTTFCSYFAVLPETLKIRIEPKALTAGTEASLFCDSSSSNPPVKLSWYKDGIPLMSEGGVTNQPGLWGGKISSTQVKLNITQDMNGVKIACQGTNDALQRSINEAIELQVLCKYWA